VINWYMWLKALHVLAVTVWVGAAITVFGVNRHFGPRRDPKLSAPLAMISDFVGSKLIAPAGGIALLSGIGTALVGHVGMPTWIWWGIASAVIVLAGGGTLLRLGFKRLANELQQPQPSMPEVARLSGRLRIYSIIAILILVSAVIAMVLKPA
jgi:uncharacterized membrane protein